MKKLLTSVSMLVISISAHSSEVSLPESLDECNTDTHMYELGEVNVMFKNKSDTEQAYVMLTEKDQNNIKINLVNIRKVNGPIQELYIAELRFSNLENPFYGKFDLIHIPFNPLTGGVAYAHFRNLEGTVRSNSFGMKCKLL